MPIEGASWPRSRFKYKIGDTKDDAGVQKEDAGSSGPGKGLSTDLLREPFESRVPRPTDTGRGNRAVCCERILSAAARRLCPVVFSELRLSAPALQDVQLFRKRIGLRASAVRRSLLPGAALWRPMASCPQKKTPCPHNVFFLELRNSDAFQEFCLCLRVP